MHGNQARTSPITMLNGTNNNQAASVSGGNPANYRPQSPFARTAHPGAVLMSPQSATRSPPPSLQQQQNSLSQFMSTGNVNINPMNDLNNSSGNNNSNNNTNNPASMLSFDDILDRASYASGGNLPSIQHPIPLSSTSSSPTPVSNINIFQNNNTSNSINNNTFNSVTGQTLLSPRVQSPLLQQYISSPPIEQQQQQQHQFLDVPSTINILNNNNNNNNNNTTIQNNNPTTTPQSGITQTNGFSQDVTRVHHWIQNLSTQQQTIVMDNILSILSDNVLSYTRSRIDNMLPSSPYPTNMNTSLEDQYNPELLNLDSLLINGTHNNNNTHHVNNKNNHTNSNHQDNNNNNNNNNKGPSMYHPWSPQPISRKQPILDMERPKSVDPVMMMMRRNPHQQQQQSNSKQMPDNNLKTHSNNINMNNNNNNNNNKSSSPIANNSMTPENLTNPLLLKSIPSWLKSLRLHKYSDCLSDLTWQQLIILNDQELEAKGVTALGARRKLLKAFNIVKDCKENNLIDKSAY